MTAIEVMTMKLLKRNDVKLKGDVILAATADEERGGHLGAECLLNNYPEKISADYVLNEGGGLAIPTKHKNVYTVQTAEKGLLWFKIKIRGTPGHGSMPNVADNAIVRMNKVIEKLVNYHPQVLIVPIVKHFIDVIAIEEESVRQPLSRLLANPELSDQILESLPESAEYLKEEIQPRISMTIAPTMIHGGVKENVIPSECEATFDCRILPGQTTAQALELIKNLLRDVDADKISFETIQAE